MIFTCFLLFQSDLYQPYRDMTENDDARIVIDDIGVLKIKAEELELLKDKLDCIPTSLFASIMS